MGQDQSQVQNSHIANDTNDDLTVTVEIGGIKGSVKVKAHNYTCVETGHFDPINSVGANASTTGGGASVGFNQTPESVVVRLPTGEWRVVRSDHSVVIRKHGSDYQIYQSTQGQIWDIDINNDQNRSLLNDALKPQ